MANINSQANVVLTVNGRQAQKMLSQLEKDARRLEQQIDKAAKVGDKASMKKFQRELNATNRTINQLKGSANSVDQTLRRLDKATPKELNKALRTLQSQLQGIQRGTAAWDAQVAKIRLVKAELQKVNATLTTQRSLWSRLNSALNNAQTAIMAVVAALTGLIMAGRKAVQAYADMEESMANTRKYTRMTAEEVDQLNDIFKGMDTRLAREQLNLLAQEGGRLGYNTVQSVREYVEAASIINVALVDLGEGATQTIAKLSNIFGMEQMYGVRDAMLKIGSTVNHLSQNCTAAKPFIVEFAQRMAGIGSTAKMTIPEIMAFAATLDANGQKVEMSATALQRTIMALFKKPGEMAQKVGLDTKQFIETLNKSTTDGVMMFLDALNKLGEDNALAVLSPLFQDLGLDGARVSSVLMNLSSHLEFLKWQMGEAAGAFRDGTSASNEYAIFNNTVQASIDKARKRVGELAIELGEKLYPIMKHIYTSSSVFLRVLNQIVTFVIENRTAIGNLCIVLASYYAAIVLVKTAKVAYTAVLKLSIVLHNAWKAVVITARIVTIAFTQGLGAATRAMKLLNITMSTSIFGAMVAAVTALILAIKALTDRTDEYTKAMKSAIATAGSLDDEYRKEQRELDTLFGKLQACTKGTKEYENVKNSIISQYGTYLKGLVNEKGEILNLAEAYRRLAAAARQSAKERSIKVAREEADQKYDDEMKTLVNDLIGQLEDNGYTYKDAVTLANRVAIELKSNGTLSQSTVAQLQSIKGSLMASWGGQVHPVNTAQSMIGATVKHSDAIKAINEIEGDVNPYANLPSDMLRNFVNNNKKKVEEGKGGFILLGDKTNPKTKKVGPEEFKTYFEEVQAYLSKLDAGSSSPDIVAGNPDFDINTYSPYKTDRDKKKEEQERKAAEAAKRREETKAKQEFKDKRNSIKGVWESEDATNTTDYINGKKNWAEYLQERYDALHRFYDSSLKLFEENNLQEDEDYQELLKKRAELEQDWLKRKAAINIEEARRMQQAEEIQAEMDFNTPKYDDKGKQTNTLYQNEEALQIQLHDIRIKYLKKMQEEYNKTSEEYHNYAVQIEQEEAKERLRIQQRYAAKIQEWTKKYEYLKASERKKMELDMLEEIKKQKLISEEEYQRAKKDIERKYAEDYLPDSAKPGEDSKETKEREARQKQEDLATIKSLYDQGIIDKEQYEAAKARIERKYEKSTLDRARRLGNTQTGQLLDLYDAWKSFFDKTEEDGGGWLGRMTKIISSTFAVVNSAMEMATEFSSACADIEIARTEKKYAREIELAEGNSYKTKQLEKRKEKEIAKIKAEQSKKEFAQKVIAAVGDVAVGSLKAWNAAQDFPYPLNLIFGAVSVAMTVAQGAMQIATLKKQQQASAAQGYASGGFTPEGGRDEVAGVVHKGEWVASQALVNNPRTRPLLEALDYAQRTNTIGSITAADVSRTITAPAVLASAPSASPTIVNNTYNQASNSDNGDRMIEVLDRLDSRLNEPFVTVNTVAGDHGIQRAQDEYSKLLKNKSPKSRK